MKRYPHWLHPSALKVLIAVSALGCAAMGHAQTPRGSPLPVEDLRRLADVYGLVQSDYVAETDGSRLAPDHPVLQADRTHSGNRGDDRMLNKALALIAEATAQK